MRLPWQVVVAVTLHDPALLASLRDSQLRVRLEHSVKVMIYWRSWL